MEKNQTCSDHTATTDYSIVIPVYFNEDSLDQTLASVKNKVIAQNPGRSCEIIFVDDGSGDGSLKKLLEIREREPHLVKVIKLTRNFGQPSARLAGLSHARGKCVISVSADGQDPPGLINEMLSAHFEDHFEIVVCERQGRDESLYRILTSKLFYGMMRKLSFSNMPQGGFDYLLVGRKALNVILNNQEAYPFFQGQILWTGFDIKFIKYHRRKREAGRSRWTFGKKISLLLDGVINYSFFPIRVISVTGMTIALLGFLLAAIIVLRRIFIGTFVQGWAGLMVVILVMGGCQMLMLGVIGEYLWRTLAQARNRDPYIIEKIWN